MHREETFATILIGKVCLFLLCQQCCIFACVPACYVLWHCVCA